MSLFFLELKGNGKKLIPPKELQRKIELLITRKQVDIINKNRNDLTDKYMYRFTQSVDRATSRSIALTFYFE